MEPFKNHINAAGIDTIAALVQGDWDRAGFVLRANDGLEALELKARVQHVCDALHASLPSDYETALAQIVAGLPPDRTDTEALTDSWHVWPLTTFVERYGRAHRHASFEAMERLTTHFSCEFAIRPFFADDPENTRTWLRRLAASSNVHHRRLASEGSRPRLPWGIRLHHRIEHPGFLLGLLTELRDDPEEYVRRSVANHLNDIAKDHPDWVLQVAAEWMTDAPDTRKRLVKHALRTQIKSGDPAVYALLGLQPFNGDVSFSRTPDSLRPGEALQLRAALTSTRDTPQRVRIDLGVHFRKKNGTLSVKVFHWTERTVKPRQTLALDKRYPIRIVTTRKLYPGAQAIDIRVNGVPVEPLPFELL